MVQFVRERAPSFEREKDVRKAVANCGGQNSVNVSMKNVIVCECVDIS